MARIQTGALVVALALGAALPGTAQAAGFDDTFGINGTIFNSLSPASDRYQGVTRAPGGGTYNVGYTTVAGPDRALVLTHVDSAGRLDRDFGVDGIALVNVVTGPFAAPPAGTTAPTGSAENARGVVVQGDGKIVIAGQAETPPAAGKPDSRDLDIYVARFDTDGTLDGTFGVGGVKRIDLSDGRGANNAMNNDQAYGLEIRPDGKLVVFGAKGIDFNEPARADRDIVAIQLESDGDLDPAFGAGGVATTRNPGIDENPRHGLIQADGKVVATGYGSLPGAPVRPFIYRFNANGTSDATLRYGGRRHG